MGLMRDKQPTQYRDFMDQRRWHYELSRRHDGSFGILGGGGYDVEKWGVAYGWAYTVPRKKLRIFGAPSTKFSKPYQLPKQPWGTEADNDFLSLEAVPDADGKKADLSGETLATGASIPFLRKFHGPETVSDELIRYYIHHQDYVIRQIAAAKVLGVNRGYIGWRAPGGTARPELMMEFLQSKSPRIRRAMFSAIDSAIVKEKMTDLLTDEVIDLAVKAVSDPEESWWVKDACLHVIGRAPADKVVPHLDLLLSYLDHSEWWLQNAAMNALTPLAADERTYRKVLPPIGELIRTNQRSALTLGLLHPIREKIRSASPEVQKLAVETLKESYTGYAGVKTAPGGQDISTTLDSHLEYIAGSLADVPGGLDVLYRIARQRYPDEILPYKEFFLAADPSQFGPELKKAITPIINDELIPEFVGRNRKRLGPLAALEVQSIVCGGRRDPMDQLVGLHERAGKTDYDWRMFLNLHESEWDYHTFDPIPSEQVPFDQLTCRYRQVTLPKGMETWFSTDFDATAAGWKTGRSPFGNYMGKIPDGPFSKCSEKCVGPVCYGATPIHTLWDKEVLLIRGTFDVPPLKEGHRYRMRVNHAVHVGNGNGYGIWINGKPFIEHDKTINRGGGEQPYGAFVTKEWVDELNKGKATIALKSFIRYNDKRDAKPTERIPQGRISLILEEQKLPPTGDDLVRKSAKVVPMLSAEWQQVQWAESNEERENAPMFRWDGEFVANPGVMDAWKQIGETPTIDEFDPEKPRKPRNPAFGDITLQNGGTTDDPIRIWSGDRLMDLDRYQALRMTPKTINGTDYLFVERGDFSNRHKEGWTSPLLVFERK